MLTFYNLLIIIYRFIRIIQRFKKYNSEKVKMRKDENNNEIENSKGDEKECMNDENNNELVCAKEEKSSSKFAGRISLKIVKLNKDDLEQVRFLSILILSTTLLLLILEIIILSISTNLVVMSMLGILTLIAMVFKNNHDQIGLINLLVYLIDKSILVVLVLLNRLNLYKGSRKYSFQEQSNSKFKH